MSSNKYLNDLGILSTEPCIFNTLEYDESRAERFANERETYGFDSRETWSLDYSFATWLYSHLKMYLEKAGEMINLEFYNFSIPVLYDIPEDELDYTCGEAIPEHYRKEVIETVTQKEAIELMIDYLEHYLNYRDTDKLEEEFMANEYIACAVRIFAEVLPAMWW